MGADVQNEDFQRLHQLIEGSPDIKGFLDGMARHAATSLSRTAGAPIACAVTLRRRKRITTVAGSSDEAVILDHIEQDLGEGPCMEALRTFETVLLADVGHDMRWPRYSAALASTGYRSVLGVPVDAGESASASLNFFAPVAGVFTEEAIDLACGMIMTQNRCSQEQAYQFILRASNSRNLKVRAVAEEVVRRLAGAKQTATHFDD
ncbi:GAF and ANTAR domain-containing protein [Arthrobacter sp. B3I9]|uniref:GAF and ANTAR domain-containing protein n=1 Tax=Arthrobacter sp. B3I9 TaxID=3042270 RepID=UPI0027D7BF86|nr:GAF and ANTAR domain-containing protein [Arthrobacter sp. B3I9]